MFFVWKREFVCLTIFLIGAGEFGEARTIRTDHPNARESTTKDVNFGERQTRGRPFNIQRLFIPLLMGFTVYGISTGLLMFVKFLLLKGAFLLKSALIISGFIFAIKISDTGGQLLQHYRDFYPEKNNQYPEDEPDLSGYGYSNYAPDYSNSEYKHSPY